MFSADERALFHVRSSARALGLAAVETLGYAVAVTVAIAPVPWPLALAAAIVAGLLIGTLFTVGHDAAHHALTDRPALNAWIARLVFIPSAHALSLWVLGHNRIHHGYTNLRGRDYVWEPLRAETYAAASPVRRMLYRLYRSPFGAFPYYLIEMWGKKNVVPIAPEARVDLRKHLPDSAFAVVGFLALGAVVTAAGTALVPGRSPLIPLALGWLAPFCIFTWTIGWIIYLHHTHPEIPWFDDPADWTRAGAAMRATAEVRMPTVLDRISNNIMDHNTHHALPSIPFYRLRDAQRSLRARVDVTIVVLSLRSYLAITAACKLYDGERRCWTDFAGRPTGPTFAPRPATDVSGAPAAQGVGA